MKFKLFPICSSLGISILLTSVSSFSSQPSGTSERNGWKEGGRKEVRVGSLYVDASLQESKILTFQSLMPLSETESSIAISNDDVDEDRLNQSKFISEMSKVLEVQNSLDIPLSLPSPQAIIMPLESSPFMDCVTLQVVPHEQVKSDNIDSSDDYDISISSDATIMPSMTVTTSDDTILSSAKILSSDTNDPSDVESWMANDSPPTVVMSFANDMLVAERLAQLEQRANELLDKYKIDSSSVSTKTRRKSSSSNKIIAPFAMLGMTLTTAMVVTAPESPLQMDLSFLQESSISNAWHHAKQSIEAKFVHGPSLIDDTTLQTIRTMSAGVSQSIQTQIQSTLDYSQDALQVSAKPVTNMIFPTPNDIQNLLQDIIVEPMKGTQSFFTEKATSLGINLDNMFQQKAQEIQHDTASYMNEAATGIRRTIDSLPQIINFDYLTENVDSVKENWISKMMMKESETNNWFPPNNLVSFSTLDIKTMILDKFDIVKASVMGKVQETQELSQVPISILTTMDNLPKQIHTSLPWKFLDYQQLESIMTNLDFGPLSKEAETLWTSSSSNIITSIPVKETSSFQLLETYLSDSVTTSISSTAAAANDGMKLPDYNF